MPSPSATEGPSVPRTDADAHCSCLSAPPPASSPPLRSSVLPCSQDAAPQETGRHLASIFASVHRLQPARAPAAACTFADAAAALMCSRLDHLWHASSAAAAAVETPLSALELCGSPGAEESDEEPSRTHPRTRLVLQLLALTALRRAGSPRVQCPSADGDDALFPMTAACRGGATSTADLRMNSSSSSGCTDRDGLSRVVHSWLCQRAAALPSPRLAADSVYGDLRTLLMEWAALTLPRDWHESHEEVRWRRACASLASPTAAATSGVDAVCVPRSICVAPATPTGDGTALTEPRDGVVCPADAAQAQSVLVAPCKEDNTAAHRARASGRDAILPCAYDVAGHRSPSPPRPPSAQHDGVDSEAPASSVEGGAARLVRPTTSPTPLPPPPTSPAHAPAPPPPPPPTRRVLQLVQASTAAVAAARGTPAPCDPSPAAALAAADGSDATGQHGSTGSRRVQLRLPCGPVAVASRPSEQHGESLAGAGTDATARDSCAGLSGAMTGGSAAGVPPTAEVSRRVSATGVGHAFRIDAVPRTGTSRPRPPPLLDDAEADVHRGTGTPGVQRTERSSSSGSSSRASSGSLMKETSVAAQPAVHPDGNATTASPRLDRAVTAADVQARRRRRRWRRLAPFVLHAPEGSAAARDVQAVLTALGFASAMDGPEEAGPAAETAAELLGADDGRATRGIIAPPCPLGRLPPLLVAHAWLAEAALRTAWLTYVLGHETCGDEAAGASHRVARPPNVRCASAAGAVPGRCTPALSPPLPCVAVADARVSAALAELLWCPPAGAPTAGDARGRDGPRDADAAVDRAAGASAALPPTFEARLHAFLAYPLAGVGTAVRLAQERRELAGVAPSAPTGEAPHPAAPPSLTLAAWHAYLQLRYAVTPRGSRPAGAGDAAEDAAGVRAATGTSVADAVSSAPAAALHGSDGTRPPCASTAETRRTEATADAGDAVTGTDAVSSPAHAVCTHAPRRASAAPLSMSDAKAAAAAASSATAANSAPYAAVMDVAAVVLLCALRRAAAQCMTHVVESEEVAGRVHRAGTAKRDLKEEDGEEEEERLSAQQRTHAAFDGGAPTSAVAAAVSGAVPEWSACSLHHFLEHVLERDTVLHPYVCDGAGCALPVSSSLPHPNERGGPADPQERPGAAADASHTSAALSTATATARHWLALVTVLCIGESDVAQYVRRVLLPPPPLLPRRTGSSVDPESDAPPSLAPFTMPTLFDSALEDLHREETAVAEDAAAAPMCPADAVVYAALHRSGRGDEAAAPHVRPTARAQTTATAATASDSLSLCAAVALRHPRVVLRQVSFLWRLVCHSHAHRRTGTGTDMDAPAVVTVEEAVVDAARAAFRTCVARLVESVQLATVAGLPPPLATAAAAAAAAATAAPSPSSSLPAAEVHPRVSHTNVGRVVGDVSTGAPLEEPPASAHELAELHTTSARPRPGHGLQRRLRLQLATPATTPATSRESVSGAKHPRCVEAHVGSGDAAAPVKEEGERLGQPPRKRSRVLGAAAGDARPQRPAVLTENGGGAAMLPPPLPALAEVRVRWADGAHERPARPAARALPLTAPSRTPPPPPPAPPAVPLLDVVSDVLWDVLAHMRGKMPEDVAVMFASDADAVANTSAGLPTAVGARRATLQLRASPAHTALQRLWQALCPPLPPPSGERPPSERTPPDATGKAAAAPPHSRSGRRLEVLVASRDPLASPNTGVDVCVYRTLAATLRGVLCTALGFAVHACLRGVSRRWWWWWRMAVMDGGAAPDAEAYAWLECQLRLVHDEIVRPLERVFTTSASTGSLDGSSAAHSSAAVPMPWLGYGPLASVLLPALMAEVDAAVAACGGEGDCGSAARRAAWAAWRQLRAVLVRAGCNALARPPSPHHACEA